MGDMGSIPGLGRSPGEGHGTHSSILVWRIPWTEESGGLQSMGSQRGRHDWATFTFTHSCLTFVENTKIAQRQVPTINKPLPPIRPHFEITIVHIFGTNLSSLSYDIVLLCVFYVYYFTICIFSIHVTLGEDYCYFILFFLDSIR